MNAIKCYCCSGASFEACCYPYLSGQKKATSAHVLMRSRYAAYSTQVVKYLIETTHFSTRNNYDESEIRKWSEQNTWLKLEVLEATETTVLFKAYYQDLSGRKQCHYEFSTFKKENDSWFYVDGTFHNKNDLK